MRIAPRVLGLTIAGVGLILVGFVLLMIFPLSQSRDDPTSPTDFGAIPAKIQINAPSLTLSDLQGVQHSLSDYRGQVVLVNLWATWCPPCKAEMPILQDYYLHHKDQGFTVIAIEDGDPTADVVSFAKELNLTFPIWLDPTYQATDHAFKTMNLPGSYVVDRNGMMRLTWLGAINSSNLDKYVTPLIKE